MKFIGSRQRYVLLITIILSINWTIASIPVMHGTFIIDNDCFLNVTNFDINGSNANACMDNPQAITPISEVYIIYQLYHNISS